MIKSKFLTIVSLAGTLLAGVIVGAMGMDIKSIFERDVNPITVSQLPPDKPTALSKAEIEAHLQSITVKVTAAKRQGSGIIIAQTGNIYNVLTNKHVLRSATEYYVQTPDGQIYTATPVAETSFAQDDLALVQFSTTSTYATANLNLTESVEIGDSVYAAGFPIADDHQNQLSITTGKVGYLLPQPFQGGYQIGYSNDIDKGMSGGPVVNELGELVAVNGKHKAPLWGNTYIFENGSTPSSSIRAELDAWSWAIPIQTVLAQIPSLHIAVVPFKNQPLSTPAINESGQLNQWKPRQLDPTEGDRSHQQRRSFW